MSINSFKLNLREKFRLSKLNFAKKNITVYLNNVLFYQFQAS